jgi:hypothetical protein
MHCVKVKAVLVYSQTFYEFRVILRTNSDYFTVQWTIDELVIAISFLKHCIWYIKSIFQMVKVIRSEEQGSCT